MTDLALKAADLAGLQHPPFTGLQLPQNQAGEAREDGTFEEGTVHDLVDKELQRLAVSWKDFGPEKES